MNKFEVKTPLRTPKKYRKSKKGCEAHKVEEFMSYGSGSYFNAYDDDDVAGESINIVSAQIEKSIEEWLETRDIFRSPISDKKEGFFQLKRDRVNSISYFEYCAENDSTDISPINQSIGLTPTSLNLTPVNSKICRKRSNFSSLAEIKMVNFAGQASNCKSRSKFSGMKLDQVQPEQISRPIKKDVSGECQSQILEFNRRLTLIESSEL